MNFSNRYSCQSLISFPILTSTPFAVWFSCLFQLQNRGTFFFPLKKTGFYHSAFNDIDGIFGSRGSFFDSTFQEGGKLIAKQSIMVWCFLKKLPSSLICLSFYLRNNGELCTTQFFVVSHQLELQTWKWLPSFLSLLDATLVEFC